MKNNFNRVMLCLAALQLTENELRQVLQELKELSFEEVNFLLRNLRGKPLLLWDVEERPRPHGKIPKSVEIGDRVEQLLKVEAGMTTSEAIDKLSLRLTDMNLITPDTLPTYQRKGMRDWVGRLAKRVSEKDILRCATIIRNEHTHSPTRDWRLSRDEE